MEAQSSYVEMYLCVHSKQTLSTHWCMFKVSGLFKVSSGANQKFHFDNSEITLKMFLNKR